MARGKRKRRGYPGVLRRRIVLFLLCISFCIAGFFVLNSRKFWGKDGISKAGYHSDILSVLGMEHNGENISEDEIPVILQNPELPSGCESAAAAMLLGAYGFDVDKEEFANALPWCGLEEYEGRVYACSPQEAFVGSPYSAGYGVFADIVAETIQKFIYPQVHRSRRF